MPGRDDGDATPATSLPPGDGPGAVQTVPTHPGGEDVRRARRAVATFGVRPEDPSVAEAIRGFTRRYGWRAYALPVLVVITVLALLGVAGRDRPASPPSAAQPAPPVASGDLALKSDTPGAGSSNAVLSGAALPPGPAYPPRGDGTFRVLTGTSPVVGSGTVHRYSVEVENGMTGLDLTQFASTVQTVLSDPRSWAGHDGVALQRVDSGPVDFHVTLVSAMTVRTLCGYELPIETSCFVATDPTTKKTINRVVIDDARWVRGDAAYIGDLAAYRTYMINHEDGHALGHEHAHACLPGGLAPAMMQQTIGLRSATTGQLCQANPWPYPPGAQGAPGAEAPDTPQNSEFGLTGD